MLFNIIQITQTHASCSKLTARVTFGKYDSFCGFE